MRVKVLAQIVSIVLEKLTELPIKIKKKIFSFIRNVVFLVFGSTHENVELC